jgi:hypothetical protein
VKITATMFRLKSPATRRARFPGRPRGPARTPRCVRLGNPPCRSLPFHRRPTTGNLLVPLTTGDFFGSSAPPATSPDPLHQRPPPPPWSTRPRLRSEEAVWCVGGGGGGPTRLNDGMAYTQADDAEAQRGAAIGRRSCRRKTGASCGGPRSGSRCSSSACLNQGAMPSTPLSTRSTTGGTAPPPLHSPINCAMSLQLALCSVPAQQKVD